MKRPVRSASRPAARTSLTGASDGTRSAGAITRPSTQPARRRPRRFPEAPPPDVLQALLGGTPEPLRPQSSGGARPTRPPSGARFAERVAAQRRSGELPAVAQPAPLPVPLPIPLPTAVELGLPPSTGVSPRRPSRPGTGGGNRPPPEGYTASDATSVAERDRHRRELDRAWRRASAAEDLVDTHVRALDSEVAAHRQTHGDAQATVLLWDEARRRAMEAAAEARAWGALMQRHAAAVVALYASAPKLTDAADGAPLPVRDSELVRALRRAECRVAMLERVVGAGSPGKRRGPGRATAVVPDEELEGPWVVRDRSVLDGRDDADLGLPFRPFLSRR